VAGGSPAPTPALAASLSIGAPQYLTVDSSDGVYFTTGNTVFRLTTDGLLTRIAGNSRPGFSGDGGPAVRAQLSSPVGLALDAAGNLYIADSGNHRIRRVAPNGVIVTVAGSGAAGFSGDGGPAASAQFSAPTGVAVDSGGNLYIADTGNHRVRKVTPDGIVTTVAGNGTATFSGDGGAAVNAQLSAAGIALDKADNLFIADTQNLRIRKVTKDGIISTVAGSAIGGQFAGGLPPDHGGSGGEYLHRRYRPFGDSQSRIRHRRRDHGRR
jgi:sugar lactone lactonase YvrE